MSLKRQYASTCCVYKPNYVLISSLNCSEIAHTHTTRAQSIITTHQLTTAADITTRKCLQHHNMEENFTIQKCSILMSLRSSSIQQIIHVCLCLCVTNCDMTHLSEHSSEGIDEFVNVVL